MASLESNSPFLEDLKGNVILTTLRDTIRSLDYRMNALESCLTLKVDRAQFSTAIDRKIGIQTLTQSSTTIVNHVKSHFDEWSKRFQERMASQKAAFKALSAKICPKVVQNTGIQPDGELPTIIDTLHQRLEGTKQAESRLLSALESKHKKTVSLNNQVCLKIERLEDLIHNTRSQLQTVLNGGIAPSLTLSQSLKNLKQQASPVSIPSQMNGKSRPNKKKQKPEQFSKHSSFDMIRTDILAKSLQHLQHDVAQKLNIHDVLPILQKSTNSLHAEINNLRTYFVDSLDSTKKILFGQAEINRQLSLSLKTGCWHSYESNEGFFVWSRQVYNLMPDNFIWQASFDEIGVTKGTYLVRVHPVYHPNANSEQQFVLCYGDEEAHIERELVVRVEDDCSLRLAAQLNDEIFMTIQKL